MIEGQLASLGASSLVVNTGKRTKSGKSIVTGNVKPLTGKDMEAIRNLEVAKYVSAISNTECEYYLGKQECLHGGYRNRKGFHLHKRLVPRKRHVL